MSAVFFRRDRAYLVTVCRFTTERGSIPFCWKPYLEYRIFVCQGVSESTQNRYGRITWFRKSSSENPECAFFAHEGSLPSSKLFDDNPFSNSKIPRGYMVPRYARDSRKNRDSEKEPDDSIPNSSASIYPVTGTAPPQPTHWPGRRVWYVPSSKPRFRPPAIG